MGSAVAWIFWYGLLDGWDWVLFSVVNGIQGLYSSLFGNLNQARVCIKLPNQVRLLTGFALHMGKARGCALCSSAIMSKAVGWATLLPMCSG